MQTVEIVLICVSAALICTAIRMERPEIATGISIAVGLAVILLLCNGMKDLGSIKTQLEKLIKTDEELYGAVFKAAGIAIVSEMGAQICEDAGEKALAGRIALASRITMLWLCLPMLERMLKLLDVLQ